MKFLKVYFFKLSTCCRQRCPKCVSLCWYEDSATNQVIRSLLLYFYGLLLGGLFWRFVLLNIGLPFDSVFLVGLVTSLFLGYGCALSIQIRCFSSLCLVGFLGKAGRSMLKAIVLSCILTGPINNLSLNAREVVRVFTCSTVLTYNMSKVRFDLTTKPFQNALLGSKENLEQVKDEFSTIVDIMEPIEQEVEGPDDESLFDRQEREMDPAFEQYRKKYVHKLRKRCETQLERGVGRCKQAFQRVYDKCHEKLPILVNYLLCWPLKIDFMCSASEMFGDHDEICSSEDVVDPEFGQDYGQLKSSREDLVGDLKDIRIEYEFVDMEQHEGYLTAKQTSKQVVQEFERKKESFDLVVFILKKIFAFIFVKVIFGAMSYHQSYLKKLDFENHYITDYFQHVDQRRRQQGKICILPLRWVEQPYLVDLDSAACTRFELRKIFVHLMTLLLQAISATIFILIDRLFFETLDIVSRHSKVDFKQEGYHDVNVTVTGTGVIAMMVRRSVEGFTTHIRVNLQTSNEECLPRPSSLEPWNLVQIYLLLLGVAVLVLNEAYINRMRRLICCWFYPKREKQRILYLYNRMLKRRKGLQRLLAERLREYIRAMKYGSRLGFLDRLAFFFPLCCGWIRIIHRKYCSVCGCKEAKDLYECDSYKCFLVYCEECWQDLKQTCMACADGALLDHNCYLDH
ncbi:protein sneaky [Ochlerotatus camptorhynchus]|uniref:protein sneaky n=1 Tax=Ochlerotatus camptorhynchus TaxID=644619 RepID=UPI0031D7E6F2